jgi:hypothetical protein
MFLTFSSSMGTSDNSNFEECISIPLLLHDIKTRVIPFLDMSNEIFLFSTSGLYNSWILLPDVSFFFLIIIAYQGFGGNSPTHCAHPLFTIELGAFFLEQELFVCCKACKYQLVLK